MVKLIDLKDSCGMQTGTSEFATSAWADQNEPPEEENYQEEVISYREPLAQIVSQMTVPETPSPDNMETKSAPH